MNQAGYGFLDTVDGILDGSKLLPAAAATNGSTEATESINSSTAADKEDATVSEKSDQAGYV